MKKYLLYLSGLLIISILLQSCWSSCGCEPDYPTPPMISVNQISTGQFSSGATYIEYEIILGTSNGDLTTLEVTGTGSIQPVSGTGIVRTLPSDRYDFENKKFVKGTFQVMVYYTLVAGNDLKDGDTFEVEFKVTDEKEQYNSVKKSIIIKLNEHQYQPE